MIFKALSEKSLTVLLGGGVYAKFKDFKHVRENDLKLAHEFIKIGYKIEKCSTNVFYVLFNVFDSLHCRYNHYIFLSLLGVFKTLP